MLNYPPALRHCKHGCTIETTTGKDTFFDENERRITKSMRHYLLLSVLMLLGVRAYAQLPEDWCTNPPAGVSQGGFNIVGISKGCAPFEVKVEKTVGDNYKYIYDYKGGSPLKAPYIPEDAITHKYLKQGTYKILQLGSNGSGSVFCQTVEVYAAPNFTAKACSNRKVQVTIADDSTTRRYTGFTIDWGDTKENVSKVGTYTHTYGASSIVATVFVTGSVGSQSMGCSLSAAPIPLNTNDLSTTSIRRLTLNTDGSVAVLIKAPVGTTTAVQVSQNNGAFTGIPGQVTLSRDTATITLKDINALKDTYCFRLTTNDGCINNTALTSNVVCATPLEVKAENRQNVAVWKEYPNAADFQNYRITRNLVGLGAPINVRTSTTQTDVNVTCGEQYCYQVTVQLAGGVESVSPSVCVKAISTEFPSMVQNAFVTVEDDGKLNIFATPPASGATPSKYKLIISRAASGSADFKEIATLTNAFSYTDAAVDPTQQSYCYQMVYENACGNRSQTTASMCSIFLSSKSGSTVDWTPETPFLAPVNRYQLEILDEQGNPFDQVPVGANTSYSPNVSDQQLFRYRILGFAQGGAGNSYSNYFVFKKNALLFIPDAFSPNGDGVNDFFAPKGQFVDKSRMIVYNRWGQALFETNNAMEGWDGTVNGQPAAEGTYVYRVEITDSLGANFVKTGTLLLAR